jgi:hypothetical protein
VEADSRETSNLGVCGSLTSGSRTSRSWLGTDISISQPASQLASQPVGQPASWPVITVAIHCIYSFSLVVLL